MGNNHTTNNHLVRRENSTVVIAQNGKATTIHSPVDSARPTINHNNDHGDYNGCIHDHNRGRAAHISPTGLPGLEDGTNYLYAQHPAERVDQACRFMFPLGFLLCNVVYWMYYLNTNDHISESERAAFMQSVADGEVTPSAATEMGML